MILRSFVAKDIKDTNNVLLTIITTKMPNKAIIFVQCVAPTDNDSTKKWNKEEENVEICLYIEYYININF